MKTQLTILAALALAPAAFAADYTIFRVCEDKHIIRTSDGVEAGHVEYIVVEPTSHRIVSTVVTGGVVGERFVAVPFASMRFGAERDIVLSEITRERLVSAPVIERTQISSTTIVRPELLERTSTHFGVRLDTGSTTDVNIREGGRRGTPGTGRTETSETTRTTQPQPGTQQPQTGTPPQPGRTGEAATTPPDRGNRETTTPQGGRAATEAARDPNATEAQAKEKALRDAENAQGRAARDVEKAQEKSARDTEKATPEKAKPEKTAQEKAERVTDKTPEKAERATDKTPEKAERATDKTPEKAGRATDKTPEKTDREPDKPQENTDRGTDNLEEKEERTPATF